MPRARLSSVKAAPPTRSAKAVRPHLAYLSPRARSRTPAAQAAPHRSENRPPHGCPHLERFDLVIPQFRMAVIQITMSDHSPILLPKLPSAL